MEGSRRHLVQALCDGLPAEEVGIAMLHDTASATAVQSSSDSQGMQRDRYKAAACPGRIAASMGIQLDGMLGKGLCMMPKRCITIILKLTSPVWKLPYLRHGVL